MGLIKSIFGGIFGLIGSIFKTLGGLVGLGKKSEFYMELSDSDMGSPAVSPSAPAPKLEVKAPPEAKTPSKAKAKASSKAAPASTQEAAAPAATSVAAVKTAAPAVPKPSKPAAPAVTSFASDYLNSPGSAMPPRRRPGPSMSPFRDMAKQVNPR